MSIWIFFKPQYTFTMKQTLYNLGELQAYIDTFVSGLGAKDHATIVALSGDLGVGKTAFVKAAAQHFEIIEDITSPTFVIQKEYEIANHPVFTKMIHIDAYRLESAQELEYLKWLETISDPQTIVFIEWPEQVQGILIYEDSYKFNIEWVSESERTIEKIYPYAEQLDTVLVPPSELRKSVLVLSKTIRDLVPTVFLVDGQKYHPHITLYFPAYPTENKQAVIAILRKLSLKKVPLVFDKIVCTGQSIQIDFKETKELLDLRNIITDTLNPFRNEYIRSRHHMSTDRYMSLEKDLQEQVHEIGYARVYQFPHISIGKIKNKEDIQKVSDNLTWNGETEHIIDEIVLYEMGPHGTCTNLITKIKLH